MELIRPWLRYLCIAYSTILKFPWNAFKFQAIIFLAHMFVRGSSHTNKYLPRIPFIQSFNYILSMKLPITYHILTIQPKYNLDILTILIVTLRGVDFSKDGYIKGCVGSSNVDDDGTYKYRNPFCVHACYLLQRIIIVLSLPRLLPCKCRVITLYYVRVCVCIHYHFKSTC